MSEDSYTPVKTTVLLSIALAGICYGLFRIYQTQEVTYLLNDVTFGPYTQDSDPLTFWAVVAFHILMAAVVSFYLWTGIEPPDPSPD